MNKEIIDLCMQINANNKCDSCSGRFNNHTCIYCGNESTILKELENKLIYILQNNFILNEDVLMSLYTIKSLKINLVDKILKENNYEEKLENKYLEIINKVHSDGLNNDDYRYILYFIEHNIIINDNMNYFINYLMKDMLLNKLDVSDEKKLLLIKKFVEKFMENRVKNPKCNFEQINKDTLGESFFDRIILDLDSVKEMLKEQKYIQLLDLIFHECTHTYQTYIRDVDKIVNYSNLMNTKEFLLSYYIPNYYNENYVNSYEEVEARYLGMTLALQYLNSLNLTLGDVSSLMEYISKNEELAFNNNRKLNGKSATINQLLLSANIPINFLNRYPVLNVEFKILDGKIVEKNIQEIINDYNDYKNGSLILNAKKEDIEFLYNYLINGEKKNKERS